MTWIQLVSMVCSVNFNPSLPAQISSVSSQYNVDETIILAVIHTESTCRPDAIGTSNDSGLMQIVPKWHQDRMEALKVDDLFDPNQNIMVGVSFLSDLGLNSDPIKALAIYNGGYSKPKVSYLYARKVMSKAEEYKLLLEN